MKRRLEKLKALLGEIHDVNSARALLDWDQQTYMPSGGAEGRACQISTLSEIAHRKFTSKAMGRLLDGLLPMVGSLPPDSDDACLVKSVRKSYEKSTKVPAKLVSEMAKASALGHHSWERARAESKFQIFRPVLEKLVGLKREYAALFAPYESIYDPLLDDFERGMKTSEVAEVFSRLRTAQVELLKRIAAKPQVDDSFLRGDFDAQAQMDFATEIVGRFGYDWKRGRQDRSAHPFTTSFGLDDVRITTRVVAGMPCSCLFSSMHECGHALYEQGISPSLARTPLAEGASMAVHESQSRLWENIVGRSLEFWTFAFPRLRKAFPAQLKGVGLERFYKAVNKVEPTLIRVEADEATYNLHIMLRFEIERRLMDGSLEAADLPGEWNSRMKEFLGVEPPDDARGVLQDVHWSMGAFGYFPTYALGNLVAAQIWERALAEIPETPGRISKGDFKELLAWLRGRLHVHGAKFTPQETVERVTGSRIDCAPFLRLLKDKYSRIYGL